MRMLYCFIFAASAAAAASASASATIHTMTPHATVAATEVSGEGGSKQYARRGVKNQRNIWAEGCSLYGARLNGFRHCYLIIALRWAGEGEGQLCNSGGTLALHFKDKSLQWSPPGLMELVIECKKLIGFRRESDGLGSPFSYLFKCL